MEQTTFQALAEKYMDSVYRVAYNCLKSPHDADDVTQEVFLRLLRTDTAFQSEAHAKHWLLRVAVNESRKLLRTFWRKRVIALDEEWDAPAPEDSRGRELLDAVMALEGKYRVAVYLYYYEGCSVKEAAAIMGTRQSTVQTWLQRAREKLRAALGDEKEGEYV